MAAGRNSSTSDLGPTRHCGAYTPGHEVHYIQARISREAGPGTPATIASVDDEGTIAFADGSTSWNHEPRRLRKALELYGSSVLLAAQHVLRVPHGGGSSYLFCLGDGPTPCPDPSAPPPKTLEELAVRATERGGFLIPGADVLRLVDEREARR